MAVGRGVLGSRYAAAGLCWDRIWSGPGGRRDSAGLASASPRGRGPTGAWGRPWGVRDEGPGEGREEVGTVGRGGGNRPGGMGGPWG